MMHGAHVGGHRAGALVELVGGLDPRRVLLVGIDVAKATWLVVAPNLPGEVMSTACAWSPTGLAWLSSSA
jgi:hypothetical protein